MENNVCKYYNFEKDKRLEEWIKEVGAKSADWLDYIPISGHKIFYISVDTTSNKWNDLKKIRNFFGVYVITTKFGNQYIGSSRYLNERLKNKMNYYHRVGDPIINIILLMTKNDIHDILEIERFLIHKFQPNLNKMGIKTEVKNASL